MPKTRKPKRPKNCKRYEEVALTERMISIINKWYITIYLERIIIKLYNI